METQKQIQYYKKILDAVCSKATCDRAKVGAIIVKGKNIISQGYNGSPRGLPHCDDIGHLMLNDHCIRTVHAEVNAIISAAKNGINIEGCHMYCIYKPCFQCMKILINSGIERCYYFEGYSDNHQEEFRINDYCYFQKVKA